jgi:hypothetical protein
MRHRGAFTYVEATTETGTLPLCRLRYVGSAHDWQVAIYRAATTTTRNQSSPAGYRSGRLMTASIRVRPEPFSVASSIDSMPQTQRR